MALTLKPQRKCINNLFLKRAVSARNALSLERVKPQGLFFSAIGIALGNSGSGNAFLSLYRFHDHDVNELLLFIVNKEPILT